MTRVLFEPIHVPDERAKVNVIPIQGITPVTNRVSNVRILGATKTVWECVDPRVIVGSGCATQYQARGVITADFDLNMSNNFIRDS